MDYSFEHTTSQHSIGSDRLRKAIERNKVKQTKRSSASRLNTVSRPKVATKPVTRRTVAKPETVEFGPIPKKTSRALTSINYRSRAKPAVKKFKLDSKWQRLATRVSWGICVILLARLIFSHGGVIDYYQRLGQLEERQNEYEFIVDQNKKVLLEIKKIKKNSTYQKKLVRDHLGLIASDEFLVVFP